jgi:hypothetical protein
MPFSIFVKQFDCTDLLVAQFTSWQKMICQAPHIAYQNLLNQLKNEKIIYPAIRCRDGNSSNRKHRKSGGNQTD